MLSLILKKRRLLSVGIAIFLQRPGLDLVFGKEDGVTLCRSNGVSCIFIGNIYLEQLQAILWRISRWGNRLSRLARKNSCGFSPIWKTVALHGSGTNSFVTYHCKDCKILPQMRARSARPGDPPSKIDWFKESRSITFKHPYCLKKGQDQMITMLILLQPDLPPTI